MSYPGKRLRVAALISGSLALGGLTLMTATAVASNPGPRHADVELRDAGDKVVGFAKFTEAGNGRVHVAVHVKGLTPGLHGIHVHNTASCTSGATTFSGAGSHHNPFTPPATAPTHGTHAGDLPNLAVNGVGVGRLNTTTNLLTLSTGPVSIFDGNGSALVIHALQDDLVTDPTGNSGARIACGIVVAR